MNLSKMNRSVLCTIIILKTFLCLKSFPNESVLKDNIRRLKRVTIRLGKKNNLDNQERIIM
jgi:hypothetical protein